MKTKTTIVATLLAVSALVSCKKPDAGPAGPAGAQGPAGPILTGNLKGYISHYDLSGVKMQTGLAGDTVKIDGTNTISITDANGMYAFNGLTTGNYNLTITKPSFGSTKIQNISFTGGSNDLFRNANISKIPTTNITSLVATQTMVTTNSVAVNNINFSGTVTPQNFSQTVIIFVGNVGATNVSAASGNNISYYTFNLNANATTFNKNVPTAEFYDLGYVSGGSAYFTGYMIGANTNASSYVDFSNNRTVFTAISALPVNANVVLQ